MPTLTTYIDDPAQEPCAVFDFPPDRRDMMRVARFNRDTFHLGYAYPTSEHATDAGFGDIGCWFIGDGPSGDTVPLVFFESGAQAWRAAAHLKAQGMKACQWSQHDRRGLT